MAKLESSFKANGARFNEIAGGLAGDIENLLISIMNSAWHLEEGVGSSIRNSAHRAAAMTRQLLILGSAPSGRIEPVDVNQVIIELADLLGSVAGEGISLELQLSAKPVITLNDRSTIQQGVILLTRIAGNERIPGARMLISTGTGRPAVSGMEGVFIALTCTGGTPQSRAISDLEACARFAGGRVEVQEDEQGWTVWLSLPDTRALVEQSGIVSASSELETVLVVDDDPLALLLVQEVLVSAGYQVLASSDGTQALEVWRDNRTEVGLVVSDVVMPGMSGLELVDLLTEEQSNLKVLLMSAFPKHLLGGKHFQVLGKPFSPEELLSSVRSVLDSTQEIRVLIVDGQRMFAEMKAQILREAEGVKVVGTANTGRSGLLAAEELKPDVAIVNVALSDFDGIELARRIRSKYPEVKVVLMSHHLDEAMVSRALDAGCQGCISIERSMEELVAAVNAVHRSEVVLPPGMLGRLLPSLHRGYKGLGSDLTARELEVLAHLASGRSNEEIAEDMAVSWHTVRKHVQNVLTKLGTHSKLEAVAVAAREGLIPRQL